MSNITKKQRYELITKISKLERYLKENSAPERFLQILNDIKQEFLQDKYGLVFEDHVEDVAENKNTMLVEKNGLCIENGGQVNLIIEGENLVVLKLLENIHSKWLSFMKNRLNIAYELLSDNGIMFINIDENETGTLLLLCHQLFGENNVDVLIWPKTDPRFDKNRVEKPFRDIKIIHEYVFVCFKNREQIRLNKIMQPALVDGKWIDSSANMETIVQGLGTTSSAKDELAEVFGDRYRFQTPKPMRLIKEFVRAASNLDSVILDFFAGSGTTGHAVMDLNKEDNGNRIFILVNNNENNICREITYERLKWAIEKEKYPVNLKYFTIAYGDRI
jgi:adenine specific DNA methylase Mod